MSENYVNKVENGSNKIGKVDVDVKSLKEEPPKPSELVEFVQQSIANVDNEIKKVKERMEQEQEKARGYINSLVMTKRKFRQILTKIQEGK